MICIDIKPLKPGIHRYEWDLDPESLDLDAGMFENLHLDARLDFHPERIFVTLRTRGLAHLVCDRTLVDFDQNVEGEYSILFSADEALAGDGSQVNGEDVRFLPPDADEIDLTDAVRDTVMLSLPQRRIAPGAEAREIPLRFGAPDGEEYIDPRWEALRGLTSRENDAPPEGA